MVFIIEQLLTLCTHDFQNMSKENKLFLHQTLQSPQLKMEMSALTFQTIFIF